jgi:hypothetical protein
MEWSFAGGEAVVCYFTKRVLAFHRSFPFMAGFSKAF